MKTKILLLCLFVMIYSESSSQLIKWDTLTTDFDYFNRQHFHTINETREYIYSFNLGSIVNNLLVISEYDIYKKDFSEQISFKLDQMYNPNEYRPNDCIMTENNIIYVVADSGYIFQKNIFNKEWTSRKIIEESALIYNIAFKDSLFGIISNYPDYENLIPELHYTEDGGNNWSKFENQIENEKPFLITSFRFFQDTMIVITYEPETKNRKIYFSFNSGYNWDYINEFPKFSSLERHNSIYFKNGKLWVASIRSEEFVFSDNFGLTWTKVNEVNSNEGIRGIRNITFKDNLNEGFALNPYGVYYTTDGLNWEFDRNHEDKQLEKLNLTQFNYKDEIYLIQDSAALKYDGLITSIKQNDVSKIGGMSVHPNPATDFITIQLSNKELQPFAAEEKVQIFDALGLEVISTPSAALTPTGEGNLRIDVSHLPAGVYFIRIGEQVSMFVKH
ncbi:MAG: T9SS type A sorting domain-containing protein [Candidatus Kapabacteria bacterium]|nr:T9SS type A sorting domain-containing protein [Ignavibacteriota bacterium]MCW5883679.1 T9SS type A sorting domain-containing protein [Candidatus Kapabacteria bacterium]